MPAVRLTAEEAVFMAQKCAARATYLFDLFDTATPDEVRARYAEIGPWVDLLRELQDELQVTQLQLLRETAVDERRLAIEDVETYRKGLIAIRAGDRDYWANPDTMTETRAAALLDEHVREAAITGSVLAKIEAVS